MYINSPRECRQTEVKSKGSALPEFMAARENWQVISLEVGGNSRCDIPGNKKDFREGMTNLFNVSEVL